MTEQYPPRPGQPPTQGQPEPHATDPVVIPPQHMPAGGPTMAPTASAHDPWSRSASTVPMNGDFTVSPETPLDQPGSYAILGDPVTSAPPKRRRRRTTVLVSSAAAVLLVGAGVAFGARIWTGAGNVEPESRVPASVGAFARVDLNPGVGDQLKINNLVQKFPTNGKTATDLLTRIEQEASTSAGLDYNTDVKAWFGGRVGFAEWTDAAGKPVGLICLASKNDSAAGSALRKVQTSKGADTFGYVVSDGYALLAVGGTTAQADAVAAEAQANKSPLASSAAYKSAVRHLSGDNLIVGYVNLHAIASLATSQLKLPGDGFGSNADGLSLGNPLNSSIGGFAGGAVAGLDKITGTIALGGSVTNAGVEIRVHGDNIGAGTASPVLSGSNVRPTLDAMPGDTVVGVAIDGLSPDSAAAKSLSQAITGLLATRAHGSFQSQSPPSAMLSIVSGVVTKLLTSKIISLGLGGTAGGKPSAQAGLQAQSTDDATSIMSLLTGVTQGLPGLTVTQTGDTIHATYGAAGAGRLADAALYKQAMAGMSGANVAAYIDVQQLYTQYLKAADASIVVPPQLAPVKAIGISATVSGTSTDELVRIVIVK